MNEKEIISSLSSLVKDPNIEKLSLELNSPNFFSILNITDREIRHSNFLAWLLSPKESHNLSTIFLKWFLKEIFSDERIIWANEFSIESMDLHNVEVFREWQNIDILIKHPKFVIAIENKINSKEHSSQLERYFRKVNDSYPDIEKAFIFLTIDGIEPESDQDTLNYISIDYGLVRTITEIILSVYKDSLSNRVKYYIEDYLLVLNRYIMKEHESVKLAQELYKNHRVAIDFIIENKPDRLSEIREIIESTIAREGYVLETCNKYYARFLTRKLTSIMPRTGSTGWKGNEAFLFEFAYWENGVSLKFVIAPGNEHNRKVLSELIQLLPYSKSATGKKWLTHFSDARKARLLGEKFEDDQEVANLIRNILSDNKNKIKDVEDLIIQNQERFE